VSTKLYGLVALAVGAVLLGPARAQAQSQADWQLCIGSVEDPSLWEIVCGPQPSPPVDDTPPGSDTGSGTGSDTGSGTGSDTGSGTGSGTGSDTGSGTGSDTGSGTGGDTGGSTGGDPPPPPPPPQCENGKHSGHSVATSGNATGHVCGGDSERHGRRHRHDHGRHLGHAAKAKAAVHQFAHWCQSFVAPRGRH